MNAYFEATRELDFDAISCLVRPDVIQAVKTLNIRLFESLEDSGNEELIQSAIADLYYNVESLEELRELSAGELLGRYALKTSPLAVIRMSFLQYEIIDEITNEDNDEVIYIVDSWRGSEQRETELVAVRNSPDGWYIDVDLGMDVLESELQNILQDIETALSANGEVDDSDRE